MFFNLKNFLKIYKNNYFNNYLIISDNYFFVEEIKYNIKKISYNLNILIKKFFLKKNFEEIIKKININKNIFKNKELIIIEIINNNFNFKDIYKIIEFKKFYIKFLIISKNFKIFKNKIYLKKLFFNFVCLKFKIHYYKLLLKKKILKLNFKKIIFFKIIIKNNLIINSSKEFYKIYYHFIKKNKNIIFFKKNYIKKNIKNYIIKFNQKNIFKLINSIKHNVKIDNILKIIFNFLNNYIRNNNYINKNFIKFIKNLIFIDFKIKDIEIKNKFNYCNWDIIFVILINFKKIKNIY